ncbi:ATP-binding cassette sub-family G member 2-like [Carassius auratus]|uniref:ATP-binding cassette sub-family G member 2-like n=1 Tax=Carassius auratus TaxID=7957 RepID=A0A6P6JN13_CARAU|nr:ATP-binding cassette sub-family G member 2-like [Carassius auratus]
MDVSELKMLPGGESDGTKVCVKVPGPTLTYQNIQYCIRESRGPCRKRGPEREILKNVSGIMKTGLNAIMGATGSGKTSLLDVIAGRKDPRGLRSGEVLVDNKVVTSDLRLMSAYVVQDDILMGTLTVRENLLFSGNLQPIMCPASVCMKLSFLSFMFLLQNQVSLLCVCVCVCVCFRHENAGGYYRTSVYFLSKVFVDLLPNRIVPIFIFSSISYYMMGLNPSFTTFLCFALTMSMVSLAGVSLAFLVSASVSTFAMANVLIALPFVFMMVFGGFLVNLNSMLNWLSWLKWASIFKYGLDAVTINEMKGQVFYSGNTTLTGEMYLQSQGIDYSVWGFWQNQVALLGIVLVCMTFAYIQLRRINRWK